MQLFVPQLKDWKKYVFGQMTSCDAQTMQNNGLATTHIFSLMPIALPGGLRPDRGAP